MRYVYKIMAFRVVDGDTVECSIDLGFWIRYRLHVRLKGIDTPELQDRRQRAAGRVASRKLTEWLREGFWTGGNQMSRLLLHSHELDKYGRALGSIFVGEPHNSAGNYLLRLGVAMPSGKDGKRHEWTDEELAEIVQKGTGTESEGS